MSELRDAILRQAKSAPQGVTMGALVDALERRGYPATRVEAEIWTMLGARLLTPCGYVRRVVRRAVGGGQKRSARRYEFMLVPWSQARDDTPEREE